MDSHSDSEVTKLRKIIGKKIKLLRKDVKKISQVELGKALGYTSSGTISQIETGERGLQLASMMKVAKFFNVHPAVLISPIEITDHNDIIILSKVINLIEIKHEWPKLAQPYLSAINGLLEHLPISYWQSLKPGAENKRPTENKNHRKDG
jgi:transcriptional regulator with XRE-family HTH domain